MSIVRSSISFSLKLSSLACSSVALSFWAATRMYLTEGDWWIRDNSISREFIHTCPTFEPILHETHYFPHYASNFIYCPAQFVRVRNFQESIELASQSFDALREAFHWSMRVLLGLEMLPISSVILFESKIQRELTWYAASMQETTASAIGFSCFESDNCHVCFSRMIYPADSLSNLDTHLHTIACRSKTIQHGPELVQVLDRAFELYIQCGQSRVEGLWLNLSRESSCWKWLSAYLSDDPELQSWNLIHEIHLEVCWGVLSISEAIKVKIDLHFVIFCDSETRCFQRSSNSMATLHKGSSSEARPKGRIFCRREFFL